MRLTLSGLLSPLFLSSEFKPNFLDRTQRTLEDRWRNMLDEQKPAYLEKLEKEVRRLEDLLKARDKMIERLKRELDLYRPFQRDHHDLG